MTALALAAKTGYVDIVRDLLDQGAYLNVVDKVCLLSTRMQTFCFFHHGVFLLVSTGINKLPRKFINFAIMARLLELFGVYFMLFASKMKRRKLAKIEINILHFRLHNMFVLAKYCFPAEFK